jgi:glutamine synthetase adenylyltransferase
MRYPNATKAEEASGMEQRIQNLARAQLINALEMEDLIAGRKHLLETRNRIALLGFDGDVVPENPDKLDLLASACGYADGNKFLARHEKVIGKVRAIYSDTLERLRA